MEKEEVLKYCNVIKPIIRVNYNPFFLRDFTDTEVVNLYYNWCPDKAEDIKEADLATKVNIDKLHIVRDIQMFHSYKSHGSPNFCKPTILEIISQIPSDYLDTVAAFEVIDFPKTYNEIISNKYEFDEGYTVFTVRLYSR